MRLTAAPVSARTAALGRAAFVATSCLVFVGFSVLAFTRNSGNLAHDIDGSTSFLLAIHAWRWAPIGLGFGTDPFQGMSDVWSGENAFLIPAHWVYALIFGIPKSFTLSYAITAYTIFACELFLSTLILARSLGMGWPICCTAAWGLPLLACPYFGFSLLYPIFMTAPSIGTTMSEGTLLLAAISWLGRGWHGWRPAAWRRDLICVAAILCLFVVLIAANPLRTILWVPPVALIALGLVAGGEPGERWPKFLLLTACALIVAASGAALFVFGMFSFTAPRFWAALMKNTINDRSMVSIWYGTPWVGPVGPKFFAAAVIGIATAMVSGNRRLRACAASVALVVVCVFLFGYVALTWKNWRGPMSLYFEFQLWPFYAVFAVWGAASWAAQIAAATCKGLMRLGVLRALGIPGLTTRAAVSVSFAASVIVPAIGFAAALSVHNLKRPYAFPPTSSPMIDYLRTQIGLKPGAPFRGRVVTMLNTDEAGPVDWLTLIATRILPRYAKTGNDYYTTGLWYYDIPTLLEYSPATSPALFRATTELLARPQDPQLRNIIVWRKPDAHALALLGVRFVIVNGQLLEPFRLVMTERTFADETLSLYEVPDVNLGTYTPTKTALTAGFDDAVKRIADPGFDPKRSVVVFDPAVAREQLRPAESVSMRMIRGGVAVDASSGGPTLLVLPFEFSHCLEAKNTEPNGEPPRLIRLNALETGVLFNKRLSARITYFTGLFHSSACRIDDSREFSRLLDNH